MASMPTVVAGAGKIQPVIALRRIPFDGRMPTFMQDRLYIENASFIQRRQTGDTITGAVI